MPERGEAGRSAVGASKARPSRVPRKGLRFPLQGSFQGDIDTGYRYRNCCRYRLFGEFQKSEALIWYIAYDMQYMEYGR